MMKQALILWVCLILAVILGVFSSPAKADHGAQTWANASSSVVQVNPTWPGYARPGFGAPAGTAPAGSGVYVALDGQDSSTFVLTAAHVVARATSIDVVDLSGQAQPAEVFAIDRRRDLALLRTRVAGLAIRFSKDRMPVGSHVCALGNSFGLGIAISCGVVSAVSRTNIKINEVEDFVQTDAAVNPGSSGGALVDAEGRLVGLVDAIFTKDADIDAGVNFAISSALIQTWLEDLREKGRLD